MAAHLVILKPEYLNAILGRGKKIECRLAKGVSPPFRKVSAGDVLFLKKSAGPVCATAVAERVEFHENLTCAEVLNIKSRYNNLICGADDYWQLKSDSKCCTLVWLKDVRAIEPIYIRKKDWRAWVVLNERQHFGLLDIASSD